MGRPWSRRRVDHGGADRLDFMEGRIVSDKPRYFTLTQDVLVPTGKWNQIETRWGMDDSLLISSGSRFVLRDGEYWIYEAHGYPLDEAQTAIVEPLLVEADSKIGQWLESSPGTYESILAALGELGVVSEDDVRRAADYAAEQDAVEFGDIERRNWMVEYTE